MWETAKKLPFGDGYQHPKWWLGAHLVTSEDTATHGYPHGRRYKKSCHNNWSHQRIRNIVTTCFFSSLSMGVKNMYNLQVGLLQLWTFHLKWRSQESKKKIHENTRMWYTLLRVTTFFSFFFLTLPCLNCSLERCHLGTCNSYYFTPWWVSIRPKGVATIVARLDDKTPRTAYRLQKLSLIPSAAHVASNSRLKTRKSL